MYNTIYPDEQRRPPGMRHIAEEEIGWPVHTELKVVVAVPRHLRGSTHRIKPAVRFPGGGGVSVEKVL